MRSAKEAFMKLEYTLILALALPKVLYAHEHRSHHHSRHHHSHSHHHHFSWPIEIPPNPYLDDDAKEQVFHAVSNPTGYFTIPRGMETPVCVTHEQAEWGWQDDEGDHYRCNQ